MIRNPLSNLGTFSASLLNRKVMLAALGASSVIVTAGFFTPAQAVKFGFTTQTTAGNTGLGNPAFKGSIEFTDPTDLSEFTVSFLRPFMDSGTFSDPGLFAINGAGELDIVDGEFFRFSLGGTNFTFFDPGAGDFLAVRGGGFNPAAEPLTVNEPVPEPVTTAGAIAAVVGMTAAARRKRREAAVEEA